MPFDSRVVSTAVADHSTPLLAVAVARGDLPKSLAALDASAGGALSRVLKSGDFTGKRDETSLLYSGEIGRAHV